MTLLDEFVPVFDVCVRHKIAIHAPAARVLAGAKQADMTESRLARAIFWLREVMVGAEHRPIPHTGLVEYVESIGWGRLAETPDREIVMGAVTQPWLADVVFRAVAPAAFRDQMVPGHVKIAWNLAVEPVTPESSVLSTETRVIACDEEARRRFRRYWRIFSIGIWFVRVLMLPGLKRKLELPGGH